MSSKPIDTTPVPASFVVEELSDAENMLRFSSFQPWLDGRQPHLVEGRIERSVPAADVMPEGLIIERTIRADTIFALSAVGEECTIGIEVRTLYTSYRVSAADRTVAEQLAADIEKRAAAQVDPDKVPIRMWINKSGGTYDERMLEAPLWSETHGNYPAKVREQLDSLMHRSRPESRSPKLILWNGEPGTGKTTAVRALARQWQPWCQMQYIADPEKLFNDSEYLTDLLDQPANEPKGPTLTTASKPDDMWRLIVAEDSDEFLRADARDRAGAALGRVLNISDGILGHHLNVMLLLTTNEDINRLHPALVRPGRCLANIEFTRFSATEARMWLGDGAPKPSRPQTLAQLLQQRGDLESTPGTTEASLPIGAYL